MDDKALEALTTIELREAELLSWGAHGAAWTEEELLALLTTEGFAAALLTDLLDAALVVRTPTGALRSRSAETIRVLATLRQAFPSRRVTDGTPLILDYRFLHRPRRRPGRTIPASVVLEDIREVAGNVGVNAAQVITPTFVSGFQRRSNRSILEALQRGESTGVMVTAGTGSGKTLAFYLPLLTWLASRPRDREPGTLGLALYPRNELLKDQLRVLVGYARRLRGPRGTGPAISIATWFGPTPSSAHHIRQGWTEGWDQRGNGYVCPYLSCPECASDMIWPNADVTADRERLVCTGPTCRAEVDGGLLRLTRNSARDRPADLMLSTTESLNRQLAAPGNLIAFGIRPGTLSAILLDEVHTYEGTTGAQNAILLRRIRHALRRKPVWVGLSATLRNADDFFGQLVDLPPGTVSVVEPVLEELEDSGAEYLLALHHDPHSETGVLSSSIQASMALARSLDAPDNNPFDPPPTSEGVFGSRLFAFTDKLDSTNRLYWDVLSAEGWQWPGRAMARQPLTLAHLRAATQGRLAQDKREPAAARDPEGQLWWLAEQLGHGVEGDRQLSIGRTSSQDRGVEADAQVVIATATLEVGFDDDRVGAVLQHKAPHDAAQFIQRRGRAGRNATTRPWTAVVLGDWGRDRAAWDAYDALFYPELPPRHLPINNLYVLRIQAVYSLLDWLAGELAYTDRQSTWEDLAGPATALFPDRPTRQRQARERQERLSALLGRLLRPGPERQRLRRHLQQALGLGLNDYAQSTVDTLLWDAPRPLLLAVVPTMRRLLEDQWQGEEPLADEAGLRTRTPLRRFVPGNLFDDLLVPDVELQVPGQQNRVTVEHLPALRAIREFCPGNVSRHFGVWVSNKRHWLPMPAPSAAGAIEVDVTSTFRAEFVDTVVVDNERIDIYTPTAAALQSVPGSVQDASSVRPVWEFHIAALGAGSPIQVPRGAHELFSHLSAHLHVHGGGIRTIRYARSANGNIWDPNARPVRLTFAQDGHSGVGLGVETHCDAIEGRVQVPDRLRPANPMERTQRLQHALTVEAELPDWISTFDRVDLVTVVQLTIAAASLAGTSRPRGPRLSAALQDAATTIGLINPSRPPGPSSTDWTDVLSDPQVLAAVDGTLDEIGAAGRSDAWIHWWRRRYTLSVAHLALAAFSTRCPGVDVDDILVDLDPNDDSVFWLSEPAPGGTGQVEAFHGSIIDDPSAFTRTLEEALTPTEAESMDRDLVSLLRSGSPAVESALEGLRTSWRTGHAAASEAVAQIIAVAHDHDIALGSPACTALSTRLAGPGADSQLLATVRSWLDLRDTVTERLGIEISPRILGAVLAEDSTVDAVLRLGPSATPQRRARAVSNVMWAWGSEAHPSLSYNPYSPDLHASIPTIRDHVQLTPHIIDIGSWDDIQRDRVHNAIREHGELILRARHSVRFVLRAGVLDLQTRPVEVGTLLCHPVVVGLRTSAGYTELRLLLREAE